MRRHLRSEQGQYLAQFVLILPLLIAFMGLVIDIGTAYAHLRMAQNAADAAAAAGGMVLYSQGAAAAEASARYYAGLHGYRDKAVEITWPSQCIRVAVTDNVTPAFVSLVWNGVFPVQAVAQSCYKATTVSASVLVLDPHACEALELSGGALMRVRKGNVHVNSDCTTAIRLSGGAGLITETPTTYVGGYRLIGGAYITPKPVAGPALADPLAGLPTPEGCYRCLAMKKMSIGSDTMTTLGPGCYGGGLDIGGAARVLFKPGVYCIGGDGLRVGAGGWAGGSGVTFFLMQESVVLYGAARFVFTPPTSGPYAGILIFQARDNTESMKVTGGASLEGSSGIIYLPAGTLDVSGGAGIHTNLVVRRLEVSGGGAIDVTGYTGPGWSSVTDVLAE